MPTIVTKGALQESAHKFRKELVTMPIIGAMSTLQHMSGRPGTVGKETVGELMGDFEIGPYKDTRGGDGTWTINPRTLETFLGNAATDFDPNVVWNTIYGSMVTRGEGLKNVDIAQAILFYAAKKLGKHLNDVLWKAKRNDNGDHTIDLFDGWDTIAAAEILATNISTEKKNLVEFDAAINETNAEDYLTQFWENAVPELQEQETLLYLPRSMYNNYCKDYKNSHGALPYNNEFKRPYLDIAGSMCTLVPLYNKEGADYIQLTPKSNMLYGYGNGAEKESIGIEKYKSWRLTMEATLFFGAQYESINSEKLLVGKLYQAA